MLDHTHGKHLRQKKWHEQVAAFFLEKQIVFKDSHLERATYRVRIMMSNLRDFRRDGKIPPMRYSSLATLLQKIVIDTKGSDDDDGEPDKDDTKGSDDDNDCDEGEPDNEDCILVIELSDEEPPMKLAKTYALADVEDPVLFAALFGDDAPSAPSPSTPKAMQKPSPNDVSGHNTDKPILAGIESLLEDGFSDAPMLRKVWSKGAMKRPAAFSRRKDELEQKIAEEQEKPAEEKEKKCRPARKKKEKPAAEQKEKPVAEQKQQPAAAAEPIDFHKDSRKKYGSRFYHRAMKTAKDAGCCDQLAKQRARDAHEVANLEWDTQVAAGAMLA
jgi:hypothetical protein